MAYNDSQDLLSTFWSSSWICRWSDTQLTPGHLATLMCVCVDWGRGACVRACACDVCACVGWLPLHFWAANFFYLVHRNSVHNYPSHLNDTFNILRCTRSCFVSGYGDVVQCYICKGQFDKWEPNDDPMLDHQRCYPHCPFLKVRVLLLTHAVNANVTFNYLNWFQ